MDEIPNINLKDTQAAKETIEAITPQPAKPKKNVHDWLRDLRMSPDVNQTTVGVATDRVTPELLMATAGKLIKLNRREVEPDAKDSLQFQRFYGPTDYFAEHVLRDANRVGRQLLWKATNKGNLDFMPVGALEQHVSDVFNSSKMANMVDNSSPLEGIEGSFKVSRIGEGGIASQDSAPVEMRLVQPSYLGFIDAVATPESFRVGLDGFMTKNVMKGSDGKLYQKFINAHTGKEELVDSVTASKSIVATPEMMNAKTDHIFAVGGKTGVRIVKKSDVDYYLPRMDDAFTNASNLVPMMSGVKELRLRMGCLHPLTPMLVVAPDNHIQLIRAKDISRTTTKRLPGASKDGTVDHYRLRSTYAKFPGNRSWFRKVVLYSGRTIITSRDHKWPVLRKDGSITLVQAEKLKQDDRLLRTTFKDMPARRTFIDKTLVTKDTAVLLGYAVRSFSRPDTEKFTFTYQKRHEQQVKNTLERFGALEGSKFYVTAHKYTVAIPDCPLRKYLIEHVGYEPGYRQLPSEILSARTDIVASFIDAYTADETKVAMDSLECSWVLDIDNAAMRDGIAFLFARLETDSLYRDSYLGDGKYEFALKLVPFEHRFGDCVIDLVKSVVPVPNAPIMIDIDIDDNMYAVANGVVTHNSKYPQQAVPIEGREPPLVRPVDEASGKDMATRIGKFLGARFANKPGTVTAVRNDRVDMLYDDGTKGSISLYRNFPMNAKGYLDNKAQVKAGQHLNKGDLVASSNYTDDKGVQATGTNLRVGWLSWKGGTYEDAIVISESAAKKLTSDTMYATGVDLDKTVQLGKNNYLAWKPAEYTKEQLENLDNDGVVKPGMILHKGDPIALAVRTTEPSPGTMGKRILTDVSATWDHEHPGVVTDVVKGRKGVRVFAKVSAPAEVGDKLSNLFGAKGVVSKVLPDDEMPVDKDGKPLEMIMSPLGLISRTNASQLHEALLGKVAHVTGQPELVRAFTEGNLYDLVESKLRQHHLKADDDFFDPDTGARIPEVANGYSYVHKLKHLSESKMSGRGTAQYSSDETPGGSGYDSSKRFGTLEIGALVGHNAFDVIQDSKLIRGQSNADFWRSVRTGEIPTMPGEPLVHKKFFAHLQGAGVNIRKTPRGISIFAISNPDVQQLAANRELKSRDTYEAKNFRPINGGLFGQDVFGINGDQWGYIQLDEPVPNPVMAEPLAKLLRMSDKDFTAVASAEKEVNGMSNSTDLRNALAKVNLEQAALEAQREFKNAPASKKDAALKRYVAVENMRRQGMNPAEYMLDRIPVLPPVYRPITSHNGLTMVADANYLYAQLLDARDDMRDAKNLPKEYQDKARSNLYRTWQELTGMYSPQDIKLRNKNVGGLLAWALGSGSPKFSAGQKKIIGTSVDTVGRGVIVPSPKVTLDQIGIPVKMAFDIMSPFVERELVKRGYSPVDAIKMTKKRTEQARDALDKVVQTHPVLMNRAPTLHKYNIMAFKPVLVEGNAIQVHPSVCPGFNADFDGNCVDFDTEIYLKISKSTCKTEFLHYILSKAHECGFKQPQNGENTMRVASDTKVTVFNPFEEDKDSIYFQMKIGEFPRMGEPVKDRNGADVYQVPAGVKVLGCDPQTGEAGWYDVSTVTREEKVHTVRATVANKSVIVSDNESLAVFDPAQGHLTKVAPSASEKRLVPYLRKDPRAFGPFGTRELGWVFGAWISDGWVTDRTIGYAKQEKCKRDRFVQILRSMHDNFVVCEYADKADPAKNKLGNSVKIHLNSKTLTEWWNQWSFVDYSDNEEETFDHKAARTALYKCIPSEMIQYGTEEFLWGLFSGLLDGDGSLVCNTSLKKPRFTCRFSTSSVKLKDSLMTLCYRLGLRASVTVVPPRGHSNKAYVVMPSTIDLWHKLDKLSCCGEHECTLIKQWKANPPADDVKDLVPMTLEETKKLRSISSPKHLSDIYSATARPDSKTVPRISRFVAKRHLDVLKEITPVLYLRVLEDNTLWAPIDTIEDAGDREVFDLQVQDAKVFAVNNGLIVWDTVNIHVPVSDAARKEALEKMLPSKNLIGIASRKIINKPEKEYMQGLYIATRMGESPDGRARIFRTKQEARDAYRNGEIDINTPIRILG